MYSFSSLSQVGATEFPTFSNSNLSDSIFYGHTSSLDENKNALPLSKLGTSFEIADYTPKAIILGDINNDGKLNITDITCLVETIGGKMSKRCLTDREEIIIGDMDDDGNLIVADIDILAETLLGKRPQNTVHFYSSEHNFVDLGLSDHTLWATTNIGADSPVDFGYYFAWGETAPKTLFTWDNYFDAVGGNNSEFYKYATNKKTALSLIDDAAFVNWGENWSVPSYEQILTLMNETYHVWTWNFNNTGKGGIIFYKAKNENDKGKWNNSSITYSLEDTYLFIPAAGYCAPDNINYAGSSGYLWSRSLLEGNSSCAKSIHFYDGGYGDDKIGRFCGYNIRPIRRVSTVNSYTITLPTDNTTNFTYNGSEQIWTPSNWESIKDYCTLSNNKQTNANESGYTVTVSLKDTNNYKWSDGTTTDKTFNWIIKKAKNTFTSVPTITGNTYVGSTLTATATSKFGGTMTYKWYANVNEFTTGGLEMTDYTTNSVVLTEDHLEYYWRVEVTTASSENYTSDTASANTKDPVTEAPVNVDCYWGYTPYWDRTLSIRPTCERLKETLSTGNLPSNKFTAEMTENADGSKSFRLSSSEYVSQNAIDSEAYPIPCNIWWFAVPADKTVTHLEQNDMGNIGASNALVCRVTNNDVNGGNTEAFVVNIGGIDYNVYANIRSYAAYAYSGSTNHMYIKIK